MQMLLAHKTPEELERYHYITNTDFQEIFAFATDLHHQVNDLYEQLQKLTERVDDLENPPFLPSHEC